MPNALRYSTTDVYSEAASREIATGAGGADISDVTHGYVLTPYQASPDYSLFIVIDTDARTSYSLVDAQSRDNVQPTSALYADFSANLAAVRLTGGLAGDVLIGGSADDTLNGGAGNDILEGGAGADTIDGGDGIDTVSYEHSSGEVEVILSNGTIMFNDAAGDTLSSVENIRGSAFADALIGLQDGSSVIEGGGGGDIMGAASVVSYEHSPDAVEIDLTPIDATMTITGIGGDAEGDHFQMSISGRHGVIGSAYADVLLGADGYDSYLDGNGGLDSLTGRGGDDTIVVNGPWATVDGGDGTDRLVIRGDSLDLINPAEDSIINIERVIVRDGINVDFSLQTHGVGAIRLKEGGGIVIGTQVADRIFGGEGSDTIAGDGGADRLSGGAGADSFLFRKVADSAVGSTDRITDFSTADGDRINVSALGFTSLQANGSAAIGTDQLLVVDKGDGNYVVVGDANHDGVRDFAVRVHSDAPLTASSFVFALPPGSAAHIEQVHHAFLELQHPISGLVLA